MIEVERKFLVVSDAFKADAIRVETMQQGFLSTDPERTVRVRVLDDSGKLTIKGAGSADGTSRFEWERELPLTEAQRLLDLCLPGMISKQRYIIPVGAHTFEVDVFSGDNQGLIVAEVELSAADEDFPKPQWLGEEVTGDAKYYNSQLAIKPYSKWLDTSFL